METQPSCISCTWHLLLEGSNMYLLTAVRCQQKDLPYAIQSNQSWGQTVAQPNFMGTPL